MNRSELLDLRNGQEIDRYTIGSLGESVADAPAVPLGSGGSGVVFLAAQQLLDGLSTRRAIKFFLYDDKIRELTLHAASGPVSEQNFRDEILNISRFRHENIVAVVGAGFWDRPDAGGVRIPYIVTDYVDGPTLQDVLDNGLFIEELQSEVGGIIDVVLRICAGIGYLHSRGFYHFDIKPKNLFLVKEGHSLRPIIGDLGVGRTMESIGDDDRVPVLGSRRYTPPDICNNLTKEVSGKLFREYQPRWDLFGFSRTMIEVIEWVQRKTQGKRTWLEAATDVLKDQVAENRYSSIDDLAGQLRWIHPGQRTIGAIEELSESYRGVRRILLPVEPVVATYRVREILDHPVLHRLRKVPQLTMAGAVFASAVHSRYEHSLGTYQGCRRYLFALQNDKEFLRHCSPLHMEVLLVSALLSNASRFPFSSIIHEIRGARKTGFDGLTRRAVLDRAFQLKDENERTILDVIQQLFPRVPTQKLLGILTDDPAVRTDWGFSLVHFLLNSSIDARVIDYLLRDSLHLGVSPGPGFDFGELLRHLAFREGRLVILSSGVSVVEQLISLRYWLFNRIYWNSPNRSLIAMIKTTLLELHERDKSRLESLLKERCLIDTETQLLEHLKKLCQSLEMPGYSQVCDRLLLARPQTYKEVDQFNRSDGDSRRRRLCDRLAASSAIELHQHQCAVNEQLSGRTGLSRDHVHVLVDVPVEPGIPKLGEDLDLLIEGERVVPLQERSGIVAGVQKSFTEQLQRVRIFASPECQRRLSETVVVNDSESAST